MGTFKTFRGGKGQVGGWGLLNVSFPISGLL
jgi:hypothetical protein